MVSAACFYSLVVIFNKKIDDIDVNNPHAIIEMRKRIMQNAALSIALMKILDTKGIPKDDMTVLCTGIWEN